MRLIAGTSAAFSRTENVPRFPFIFAAKRLKWPGLFVRDLSWEVPAFGVKFFILDFDLSMINTFIRWLLDKTVENKMNSEILNNPIGSSNSKNQFKIQKSTLAQTRENRYEIQNYKIQFETQYQILARQAGLARRVGVPARRPN